MKTPAVAWGVSTLWLLALLCPGEADAGRWTRYAGALYAINVPGQSAGEKLSLADAQAIVSKYRWIYVNSSLTMLSEARGEAASLSDALHKWPIVVVYMPRFTGDGQRGGYHPAFQASLSALIRHALKDGKPLLVSARSYGVHQALRVIRENDSPKILLTGIAPAFGSFGRRMSRSVFQYSRDVLQTKSKYCMIASKDDTATWKAGGAADETRGDRDVYSAMKRNDKNVTLVLLDGAEHTPLDKYLRHGLAGAIKQAVEHFGMGFTPVGDIVYGRKPASLVAGSPSDTGKAAPGAQDRTRLRLRFPGAFLTYDAGTKKLDIVGAGAVLSQGGDWETKRVKPGLYHLRRKGWQAFFWAVNTATLKVYKVTGGYFGSPGGRETLLPDLQLEVQRP